MKRVFIDSNIPMYWAGRESQYKEPCGRILKTIAAGQIIGVTSTEVFQEILYRFWHLGQIEIGCRIFDGFRDIISEILSVTEKDIYEARELTDQYVCGPRDLLHVAVMNNNKINVILSADKHFDAINTVQRIDPLDFDHW